MNAAIGHFKKYNLDALFIATNAPGRSAFNRVERGMAPLSKELAGVILPHDHFRSHLDDNGKTMDIELQKENFKHAGKVLAEIWSGIVIDGSKTVACYVEPDDSEKEIISSCVDADWSSRHVRESHYFFQVFCFLFNVEYFRMICILIQVVKCSNFDCCFQPRSSYFKILNQFVPAPLCVIQDGLTINDNSSGIDAFPSMMFRKNLDDNFLRQGTKKEFAFDYCCPSVKDLLQQRTCHLCGIYHALMKSLKNHYKLCKSQHTTSRENIIQDIPTASKPMRPVRVAAKRQKERVLIWKSRLNDKHMTKSWETP